MLSTLCQLGSLNWLLTSLLAILGSVVCNDAFAQPVNAQPAAYAEKTAAKPQTSREALIEWLVRAEQVLAKVDTYRCWLVSREEISGKLGEPEQYYTKIRHRPFSVYMACAAPKDMEGQEAIYVDGQNDNLLLAHLPPSALTYSLTGTVALSPDSFLVMRSHRHPITSTGIKYITERAKWKATGGLQDPNDVQVTIRENVKLDKRPCTVFQVVYTTMRKDYDFRACSIYFDNELQIPIRYEAFADAKQPGKMKLIEEYSYYKIELNPLLTDMDFSKTNKSYRFP